MSPQPPALPGEEWRPVAGYEGTYSVSSLGRIWSVPRPRTSGGILSPSVDRLGYQRVYLCVNGIRDTQQVHRVVARAFHGPCPMGLVVRHLDGNPGNNRPRNLRYGTSSENNLDIVRHGRNVNAAKTHCPQGHPYDAKRVQWARQQRVCAICSRASKRAYKARKRAAARAASEVAA